MIRPAIVLCTFILLFAACEPQLRIRNLSSNNLRALGYTRFDVVIGPTRSYTNVIDLSNGRATLYQAMEPDGNQWANIFTITAARSDGNVFTNKGSLVPDSMRSMFQRGNRYVWDLTTTNDLAISLD